MRTRTNVVLIIPLLLFFSSNLLGQVQPTFAVAPEYSGGFPVAIADFNQDGNLDIVSGVSTLLGNGDGTFRTGTRLNVTLMGQYYIATADFNGDGKPDIAFFTQGGNTPQPILIFLGKGDGTFQPPISVTPSSSFSYFAVADVNNDGKPDLLTVDGGALVVYLGKGDGTFNPLTPNFSQSVQYVADFNGDGKPDILWAVPGTGVMVALGNGDGTFQSTALVSPFAGQIAVIADFNNDGKLDLGVMVQGTCIAPNIIACAYSFGVQLGNGDGTFRAIGSQIALPPGSVFYSQSFPGAAVGDLNGDGKADLVYALQGTIVGTLLGNGDGTFTYGNSYAVGNGGGPKEIAVADFSGDHKLDIIEGQLSGLLLSVLIGNGDDTFAAAPALGTPMGSIPITADFNGDGRPDVAVVGVEEPSGIGEVVTFLDSENGLQESGTLLTGPGWSTPNLVVAEDLNHDGKPDLLEAWSTGMLVFLGNGDGTFTASLSNPLPTCGSLSVPQALGDFNGDHIPDVAATGNGLLFVCLGKGDGTFEAPMQYLAGSSPGAVAVGDFNGDGKLDIAVANPNGTGILFGNGDGTFQPITFPNNLNVQAEYLITGDVNLDSKVDLIAVANPGLEVYLGNGDGTFRALSSKFPATFPIVIGDLNGDGNPDLLMFSGNSTSNLCLGRGDGTFSCAAFPYGGSGGYGVIADFNGDGRPDIAVVDSYDLAILLNTTPDAFAVSASGLSPSTVAPGSSTTSTITVAPSGGFKTAVTLSCNGEPAGITCDFNPQTVINASGTSMLTVNVASNAKPGAYSLTVTGTAGGTVRTTTVSLGVGGFSMSAGALSPASVTAGGSATSTITLTGEGSLSGGVTLSCSSISVNGANATSAPPTCSFNPGTVANGSGTSKLTVSTTGSSALLVPSVIHSLRMAYAMWLPICGMVLIGVGVIPRRITRGQWLLVLLAIGLSCLILLPGCGGSGGHSGGGGTPAGTYTITVSASASGFQTQTTKLTLIVQ
jgi:FG-GAP-like repeat